MIRAFVILTLAASGYASRYDPGVFERVVQTRMRYGQLEASAANWKGGYIALLEPDLIGQTVYVCHQDECEWLLVADCAGHADGGYAWMVRGGYAGELDYETAMRWGAVGGIIHVYVERTVTALWN